MVPTEFTREIEYFRVKAQQVFAYCCSFIYRYRENVTAESQTSMRVMHSKETSFETPPEW